MNAIYRLFNIEQNERRSVLLLMLLSVFLGVFNGTFYIGSHTLFLDTFGKEEIANAYIVSGVVGILITIIYSFFQARVSFSWLAKMNLIAITIITVALRLSYNYLDPKTVDFAYFVLYGPLNIIAIVAFWGMVNRIFTLRQGKRLFGIIDSGIIFGIIISSISVPLIPYIIGTDFDLKDLLLISSVSIALALVIQFIIGQYGFIQEGEKKEEEAKIKKEETEEKRSLSLGKLFKERYTRAMSLFVGISVIVAFFAQYSFMAVAEDRYPEQQELANFLGIFTTTLMVVTFLIKTFLFSRLIKAFGHKTSLLALPTILLFLTICAVLIGTFADMGDVESQGFLSFFLIISLSKLIAQSLKEGIELPSFKLLYHSVRSEVRHDVQAKIDGTVNELFALLAGGLLAVLGIFSFIDTVHYSYFLILLLGLWAIVTVRLYKEYRHSLQVSLERVHVDVEEDEEFNISSTLGTSVRGKFRRETSAILDLIEESDPLQYSGALAMAYTTGDPEIRSMAKGRIIDSFDFQAAEMLNQEDKQLVKSEIDLKVKALGSDVQQLAGSSEVANRVKAAQLIRNHAAKDISTIAFRLLRDTDPTVKHEAIISAARLQLYDVASYLVELLSDAQLGGVAYSALKSMGENIADTLEIGFHKTGADMTTRLRVIQLLGEINNVQTREYLVNKLTYPSRRIVLDAVKELENSGYEALGESKYALMNILNDHLKVMAWNLAVQTVVEPKGPASEQLATALEIEQKENYDALFSILKLIYDPKSIEYIKENLEAGTPESIGYAIELLELFVAEEVKPKLFPLFEDVPDAEKVKKLEDHYPIEHIDADCAIEEILAQDITNISAWTKCCAVFTQEEAISPEVKPHLVSNLFNSDEVLNQSSAFVLSKNQPDVLDHVSGRIEYEKYTRMMKQVGMGKNVPQFLLFHKINYLQQHPSFSTLNHDDIMRMAQLMQLSEVNGVQDFDRRDAIVLIQEGEASIYGEAGKASFRSTDIVVPEEFGDQPRFDFGSYALIFRINRQDYKELLGRKTFLDAMLTYYQRHLDEAA